MQSYPGNPNFHQYPVQYPPQSHPNYFIPYPPQYFPPHNHTYQNWNQEGQYFNPHYQNQNFMRYSGFGPNLNQSQV